MTKPRGEKQILLPKDFAGKAKSFALWKDATIDSYKKRGFVVKVVGLKQEQTLLTNAVANGYQYKELIMDELK
jgi:hypothetical protein